MLKITQRVRFKTDQIRRDWNALVDINPGLVKIVLDYAEQMGEVIVLTSIFREGDTPSVHAYWRGVDARTRGHDRDKIIKAVNYVNNKHIYGRNKLTALWHDVGQGDHVHFQNINGTKTKGDIVATVNKKALNLLTGAKVTISTAAAVFVVSLIPQAAENQALTLILIPVIAGLIEAVRNLLKYKLNFDLYHYLNLLLK